MRKIVWPILMYLAYIGLGLGHYARKHKIDLK